MYIISVISGLISYSHVCVATCIKPVTEYFIKEQRPIGLIYMAQYWPIGS